PAREAPERARAPGARPPRRQARRAALRAAPGRARRRPGTRLRRPRRRRSGARGRVLTNDLAAGFDSVTLTDVSRHFGRRRALARVSLEARGGEVVGLLGPNGAGKSTLMGVLATLVAPNGGDVRYGGRAAREWGPRLRAQIGLLAHELHLYTELSARQNLAFFASLYGLDPQATVAP